MTASSRTTALLARRAKLVASLAIAETSYDTLLAQPIESFTFNSGDGSQAATRRKLDDLKKQVDLLNSQIEAIDARLNGGGIVGLSVTRW
jgi:hypothetical protein